MQTTIERADQSYFDDPVYVMPKKEGDVSRSVRAAFGDNSNPQPLLVGHERVRLRWMKPDGKGGLIPRGKP